MRKCKYILVYIAYKFYTDMYSYARTPTKIFMYIGFRSAARSWNVCRYTHISNLKIHSVYIGLYLTDSR